MSEISKRYFPKYHYLLLNVLFTAVFLGFGYFLIAHFVLDRYNDRIEPMGVFLTAICILVPIILNVSTIPHYRMYGVDESHFSINGKRYDWKNVGLAGYETHEKRLTLAHVLTVARSEEENMRIVILDPDTSQIMRRFSINNKIFKDYYDLEYEIREHLKKPS